MKYNNIKGQNFGYFPDICESLIMNVWGGGGGGGGGESTLLLSTKYK